MLPVSVEQQRRVVKGEWAGIAADTGDMDALQEHGGGRMREVVKAEGALIKYLRLRPRAP